MMNRRTGRRESADDERAESTRRFECIVCMLVRCFHRTRSSMGAGESTDYRRCQRGRMTSSSLRRMSRRGFVSLGGGPGRPWGWQWLVTRRRDAGLPWPLRRVLEFNERLGRGAVPRVAPVTGIPPLGGPDASGQRQIGLDPTIDPAAWRLRSSARRAFARAVVHLDEIKALPRVEMTTELRCIEGWSTVVHWAGLRWPTSPRSPDWRRGADERRPAESPEDLLDYAALETPDDEYYVGLDMASALHPRPCSATRWTASL